MSLKSSLLCILLASTIVCAQSQPTKQMLPDSPLSDLTRTFPTSIAFKNDGRLVEFCPDNTCDAFSAQAGVRQSALEDFAFLYEFYFSDFAYLDDWRTESAAKATAQQVLAKPEYRKCYADEGKDAARCVLKAIAGEAQVRLLFVRYDEHQRTVATRDLAKELSQTK